jgi:hypothetical protein
MPSTHDIAAHIRRDRPIQKATGLSPLPHNDETGHAEAGKRKPYSVSLVPDHPPGRFWSRLLKFRRNG